MIPTQRSCRGSCEIRGTFSQGKERERCFLFLFFFYYYFARQDRYDGVSEWYTTAFAYREIVRMRIVRRQRGRYRGDEIRRHLLGPVCVAIRKFLCNKFLYALLDGRRIGAEASDAHRCQNVALVRLRLERHCDDVVV